MKYKVGYLDEDEGWKQTFYSKFKNHFEVEFFDLSDCSKIDDIVQWIEDISLNIIIIDFRLNDSGVVSFNGNDVTEAIIKKRPHFPIIILTSYEEEAISQIENVNIVNGKCILDGEKEDQDKLDILITKVKFNIEHYKNRIDLAENRINNIIDKKLYEPLNIEEEEELTKLYMFLDEINPSDKSIPSNLIQPESITKLNEFVKDTKKIIEQLKSIGNA